MTLAGQNRLMVRHKVSIIQSLPESYKARIERIPGVAAGHASNRGSAASTRTRRTSSCKCPWCRRNSWTCTPRSSSPPEQKKAWLETRTGAIVGRKTAERFHWKIGDKVPIQSSIWTKTDGSRLWEFDIVGIFDGREKDTDTTPLFFRYDYFDEARRGTKGKSAGTSSA